MELTLVVQDLKDIVIKSESGELYRLVREDDLKNYAAEIETLIEENKRRIISQTDLRKEYGIGHTRLKDWVAQGLSEIHDGNRIFYDLSEVYEFMNNKKI